jgi:hypothetical protein
MNNDQFITKLNDQIVVHIQSFDELFRPLTRYREIGFNGAQFQLYRDNFFFRTATTIESIIKVVAAADREDDRETLNTFSTNLHEEAGERAASRCHRTLLETSHNIHAKRVFNIDWLSIGDSGKSRYLLVESKSYREVQRRLYGDDNYVVCLAASYAQETLAGPMLETFYQAFFKPYCSFYGRGEFESFTDYFTIHLGGMESEHSQKAQLSLISNCKGPEQQQIALDSCATFLHAQMTLWSSLMLSLQGASNKGEPVDPLSAQRTNRH